MMKMTLKLHLVKLEDAGHEVPNYTEIAEAIGTSRANISAIARGVSNPSWNKLNRILNYLNDRGLPTTLNDVVRYTYMPSKAT